MMVANSTAHLFTSPSILSSSHSTTPTVTLSRSVALNFLPSTPKKKLISITASSSSSSSSSDTESAQGPSSSEPKKKNPVAILLEVPKTLWRQTLRPLSDFGFGRRSIWEGGVGLFLVSGAVLLALSLVWLRGFQLRSKFRKYLALFEFSQACGISTGTPVRIRGVSVGNVIRVNPSLKCIEAVVEVEDDKTIIPRNALIEVNQSGLLMETVIDITPRDPIPRPSVGPLDAGCVKEGLIVCDRERLKGVQGVSLDALVGIFTRIGREVEEIGVTNTYLLAERAAAVIEEARPLLLKMEDVKEYCMADAHVQTTHHKVAPAYLWCSSQFCDELVGPGARWGMGISCGLVTLDRDSMMSQIKAMADDLQPLLAEVRDSGLLKEVESLTKSLTEASEDLRKVHSSVMTPENTELMQKSIYNLIFTLKNIESISSDILGFTGDEATRKNLKLVIKSLSRLL